MTAKLEMLERALFIAFVGTTNALVVMGQGWAILTRVWASFWGIVPVVSLATLASFLTFALFEDHLRSRRYWADRFHTSIAQAATVADA